MSDPNSSGADTAQSSKSPKPSLLDRLQNMLRREPSDREGIKNLLDDARARELIDAESYAMIKGSLAISELTVDDVMVPRSRMDMLEVTQPVNELVTTIIETAHSRFPVYEDDRENILGILLAKDLLRSLLDPDQDIRTLLRPAMFVPETKRLDALLHDFRRTRNHLAIVIDEHGGISGLISMEDVLEQIVGAIEDEYDEDSEQTIFAESDSRWRVLATTDIDQFNASFGTDLPEDEYDTIGGWLASELERIPQRGDQCERGNLTIEVIRADSRRALWLRVQRNQPGLQPAPDALPHD
ncbi:HlyC/CorC family transporter [Corticimicrobacter populi]|uniref:Magnesium and cobalt efflux protein CorC n=1 Tax=Corticimicrobacter populi TaxID=2175229 RepID=A0A2V1K5L5_9BURK|nr:transporter associated domain-containing protein [Corticimicrobacter populi]PWF24180.1 magnesium/cobalt efflux protein [Corticimicrobacter populi]